MESQFFQQVDTLLDWKKVSKIIDRHYKKGQSVVGNPGYDGLLLFKMCLLQTWYGLSDYEVEDRVNDSISFSRFCGLTLEQPAPAHSTVSRFRTAMTKAGAYEKLFKEINGQLESHKIIVKTGAIVDAGVVDTPLKPKGKVSYRVTEDRKDEQEVKLEKDLADSVDKEATWLKRGANCAMGTRSIMLPIMKGWCWVW